MLCHVCSNKRKHAILFLFIRLASKSIRFEKRFRFYSSSSVYPPRSQPRRSCGKTRSFSRIRKQSTLASVVIRVDALQHGSAGIYIHRGLTFQAGKNRVTTISNAQYSDKLDSNVLRDACIWLPDLQSTFPHLSSIECAQLFNERAPSERRILLYGTITRKSVSSFPINANIFAPYTHSPVDFPRFCNFLIFFTLPIAADYPARIILIACTHTEISQCEIA